jgi:hypothetical protein
MFKRPLQSSSSRRALPSVAAALFGLAIAACDGGGARSAANDPYGGEVAALFDDVIDAGAVGLDLDRGKRPEDDALFRRRVAAADAVLRVRVQTVNSTSGANGTNYSVVLVAVQAVSKRNTESNYETPMSMSVLANSESARLVGSLEGRLVGKTFVALVRGFGRSETDQSYHFHLLADTKAVVQAVANASAHEQ